jgi:hypothetical protein
LISLIIFIPAPANLVVSAVALALGGFIAASPHRAARIWASQRVAKVAFERRASFIRWWRILGILLSLAGLLFAIDIVVSSN